MESQRVPTHTITNNRRNMQCNGNAVPRQVVCIRKMEAGSGGYGRFNPFSIVLPPHQLIHVSGFFLKWVSLKKCSKYIKQAAQFASGKYTSCRNNINNIWMEAILCYCCELNFLPKRQTLFVSHRSSRLFSEFGRDFSWKATPLLESSNGGQRKME